MKKLKFVCFTLITIFLFFFGVFSFGVEVKANNVYNRWYAPGLAKDFYDFDGRGIRLYIHEIWGDEASGEADYVIMFPVRNYYFSDGELETGVGYVFGRNFFSTDLLNDYISEALQYWGSGEVISEWDRAYVYFQPWNQRFTFEFRGSGLEYAVYCIEEYYYHGYDVGFDYGMEIGLQDGYDYGYYVGYNEGIMIGESEAYEEGFKAGQKSKLVENNQAFYAGIEKWLVPAIITVIALGGFVTIAVNKRRGE